MPSKKEMKLLFLIGFGFAMGYMAPKGDIKKLLKLMLEAIPE